MAKKKKDGEELIVAYIKFSMVATGITMDEVAAAMRISKSTLFKRFKSPGSFTVNELARAARKFNQSLVIAGESPHQSESWEVHLG